MERTVGAPQDVYYHSDAIGIRNFLPVRAEHVLPYLASDLTGFPDPPASPTPATMPRMLSLAARAIAELGFEAPLQYVASLLTHGTPDACARAIDPATLPDALLANYDLVIFDLSLDEAGLAAATVERVTDWPRDLRYSLGAVARCLEAWAGQAGRGASTRRRSW